MRYLLVLVLVCIVAVNAASIDDPKAEVIFKKKKHDQFFKSLTEAEQSWILRLALQHESQRLTSGGIHPPSPDTSSNFEIRRPGYIKPVSELSLIPEGLYEAMLNGQVSSKFHRDFINWLRREYGIEDEDFVQFNTRAQQICHNGKCWNIGDIGSECCPF